MASKKAKTAIGSTPFDIIVATERKEQERVAKETEAMEQEKQRTNADLIKRNEEEDLALRNLAKEELKEYKDNELKRLIAEAGQEAEKETKKLKQSYQNNKDLLIKKVLDSLASYLPSSPE